MKVSFIVNGLHGTGIIRIYHLAQLVKRLNHDAEVLGFLSKGESLYPLPPPEIPVFQFPFYDFPAFLASGARLLMKAKGEVLWTQWPMVTTLGLSLFKKYINFRRVICDMDDWALGFWGGDDYRYNATIKKACWDLFRKNGELRNPRHGLYRRWMERLVSRADAVIVVSRFLQKRFGGVYLPNFEDTDLFDPDKYDAEASRARYGLSKFRILMFPGEPQPRKGVEDVLLALDKLNEDDLRLVIVSGSCADNYDDQLAKKWGRWIIKLPGVTMDKVPEAIAASHAIVVPQRDELVTKAQSPLKLFAGMAMAKPILATKVGDIPEVLEDAGYLVEPNNPDQIAEAIKSIFARPDEAQKRGLKARDRCKRYYSFDAMSNVLSGVLNSLKIKNHK